MEDKDIAALSELLRRRVDEHNRPLGGLSALLSDIDNIRLNSKVLASYIAELTYYQHIKSKPLLKQPQNIGISGRICREADFSSDWFLFWTDQLKYTPYLHRKVWEDAYALQCLWELGMFAKGKSGLGFAVGAEALPAYFVGQGAQIVATDLGADDSRAEGWRLTDQHASDIKPLWREQFGTWEQFSANCSYRPVDMTAIPADLNDKFDFCWSICAFEHLGSIEKGLQFVCNAMKTLKPGGAAVHTTEYNFDQTQTIDNWGTVLFQKKHFEILRERLEKQGDRLLAIDFEAGSGFFDSFVDVPPFPHQYMNDLNKPNSPHVKISVDGFPSTSIAIIAIRGS
ncbi:MULTISPECIES: class I SAM-dependent methyltransferase [unclassified Beijerinckia]|uniref:class I SAM-dependent methyltransferase n=1 Tax=unclassified Beijerinckia TaxID=2638183 RepID=UPI00089B197C|nr:MULTISPECIES: class I SAM-dependent methyltransferase [unclassified Beijerinckia]MDH7797806.1 SAM-dependent methyltransferase [Beijerinckia sp. GAS462]SEC99204.1 Methyltransferase domain-containing protein [Beijerinckia sp. 28-YEA-48]